MGVKGIFRFILRRILEATIVIGLITFLPNLPPYVKFSDSIRLPPSKPLEGKLALNEKLENVEIWHKGDLLGPEAFADFNGELYTSIYGGDIVKLTGNDIKPVAKTGKPCKGFYEERICGRPLGMQFNKNGDLFVADAYYGIMKVDVKTGQKQVIISPDQEIGGRKAKLFNSIALAENGDIYWTDSSEFSLENGVFGMLADPSGRLIHYDAKTKKNKVLVDKIHFANGVLLSDDEKFVLVAETVASRVYRYHLKGLKKGTHDVFIDGLPGLPDNLKSDGQGGVLVTLVRPAGGDSPSLSQILLPFPLMRKFVARVFGIIELGFETLNNFYPCEFAQKAVYNIGHFTTLPCIVDPSRTVIIRLSRNGDILENLSSTNKKLKDFCEAHIYNNNLYLASPFNDFIGRIPLSEIGWQHLGQKRVKRDVPVVQPKAETVPATTKPSTTTAKPVTKQQTPPPKQQTPPPKQQTPPPKQQTPPPKQQTTPPPPTKQQKTTPPPKQQPNTASSSKQTHPPSPNPQTTPPTPKQQTPPSKQQTAPPPKQQTAPPPKQQTTPPPKQQTTPPPKQQKTPPPKQQTTPPTKQQTTPPPKQQTTPPPKQQTTPPPKQQTTPPPKQQTTPPPKQQTTPPPKQQTAPPPKQQTESPQKQTPPKQQTASTLKQQTTTKQADKEEIKAVPVKESTKSTNLR